MRAWWPAAARAEAEETAARPPAAFRRRRNLVANRALANRARYAFCSTLPSCPFPAFGLLTKSSHGRRAARGPDAPDRERAYYITPSAHSHRRQAEHMLILTSLYRSYIHVNEQTPFRHFITTCARTPSRLGLRRPPGAALVVLSLHSLITLCFRSWATLLLLLLLCS